MIATVPVPAFKPQGALVDCHTGEHECPILIPAYRPDEALISLVGELRALGAGKIVIVDDGSGPVYQEIFETLRPVPGLVILSHARNSGKGAALKTGIRYIVRHWPGSGIVTADADGQHHPEDILQVRRAFLNSPNSLILGARGFDGPVPIRSRFGNSATQIAMKLLLGQNLRDTQTGLRAIPASLLPALSAIRSHRYEFELEMLIAAKHLNTPITEHRVRTIYAAGNKSSHFNPVLDSMRIYFVLLRFSMISLATAGIDNAIFVLAFWLSSKLLLAQICGRAAAVAFNYRFVRNAVFHSNSRHAVVLPRYLMLVLVSGSLSYAAIVLLAPLIHTPVIPAKIAAETTLFFVNFAVQRDFVFTRRARRTSPPTECSRSIAPTLDRGAADVR